MEKQQGGRCAAFFGEKGGNPICTSCGPGSWQEMGLLDTFIMTNSFKSVPNDTMEAAKLDGCSNLGIIFRMALPWRISDGEEID